MRLINGDASCGQRDMLIPQRFPECIVEIGPVEVVEGRTPAINRCIAVSDRKR